MNKGKNRILKFFWSFALLLALGGAVFAQERTWNIFSPDDKSWSIIAPGAMLYDPNALDALSTKGAYSYSDADGFFAVVYEDSPKWEVFLWKPFIGSHYKKIRNGFVKSSNGELLKDRKFTNGGVSGREFYVKIPDGRIVDSEGQPKMRYRTGRFRIFFRGTRCYMLLAVLPAGQIDAPEINTYFNSFVAR